MWINIDKSDNNKHYYEFMNNICLTEIILYENNYIKTI